VIPEYDSSVFFQPVAKSKAEVVFRLKKMLPEFVFDDAKMEGNPFTFPEVKTVLDGITVGGHKISDHEQIVNLRNGYSRMVKLATETSDRAFMAPESWIALNALVVSGEALEVGHFRTGKVGVAGVSKEVPEAGRLEGIFKEEIDYIFRLQNPLEKAYLTAAWGMINQFFWDGNKRTSRLVIKITKQEQSK
jgi:Fic family protein